MKKNVAGQVIGVQMVAAADGSAFTGSVTVSVTGDAGTQATGSVGSGACTHEGNGYHTYAPAQAETNYDLIGFTFTGTGAIPSTVQVYTSFPQTGDNFARLGAPVGASISADVAGVQSDTNDIQTRLPAALVSGRIDASVGAMAANVLTAAATAADFGAEIADAVWDEATSGHTTAGTTGKALTDAGSAGDPWSTAVPGAYSAGSAGYILGTNLNATVSSRATQTSVDTIDDFLDTEIAAIKAKTDNLPAAPAAVGDIPTATQNADALLKRDMSAVTGESDRSPLNAFRFLRNKWAVAAGTLTVKKEDDTTTAWTGAISSDAAAEPVVGLDPA